MQKRTGGCNCGKVRFHVEGNPIRIGVCHGANEVEIRVGAFDNAPSELVPTYELWIERRESWLRPIYGAEQHAGNRS